MKTLFYIRRPGRGAVVSTKLTDLSAKLSEFMTDQNKRALEIAARTAADSLIGDGSRGLRNYPPYKYVTRKRAYGRTFVSERQRRFVMARIREGRIEPGFPHRTGKLQRGWKRKGRGTEIVIYNSVPHVLPVMGDETQSRHERLVGWRTVSERIHSALPAALRDAKAAVKQYYKERK